MDSKPAIHEPTQSAYFVGLDITQTPLNRGGYGENYDDNSFPYVLAGIAVGTALALGFLLRYCFRLFAQANASNAADINRAVTQFSGSHSGHSLSASRNGYHRPPNPRFVTPSSPSFISEINPSLLETVPITGFDDSPPSYEEAMRTADALPRPPAYDSPNAAESE